MDEVSFFFDGWMPIIRVFVVGTLSYLILLLMLRIGGKRTMAQMNGFDFVITVAIGSTFGRLITAKEVALAESAAAFLLLVLLQVCFSWMHMKFTWFTKVVEAEPTLLFYKGIFMQENIRRSRVNESEIIGVIRQQGIESLDDVEAVVLETSGGWAVVRKNKNSTDQDRSTLKIFKETAEINSSE